MIKAIAIDDEPLALRVIESLAARVPFIQLVKATTQVTEAIQILQQQHVDLVFLDIQMPQLTGLQCIPLLRPGTKVILTTAYSQYALDSYEYDVVDYLLKPIEFDRFLKAAQKAFTAIYPASPAAAPAEAVIEQPVHDFIFVKTEHRLLKIKHADILFVEGGKDYITIHTTTGKVLSLSSLNKMQEILPPQFIRVHRSYLVAIDKIDAVERQSIIISKAIIPIGEMYRAAFFERIGKAM